MHEMHAIALLKKLQNFVILSDLEKEILIKLYSKCRIFLSGQSLVSQGQSDKSAYFLIEGWICSYKIQIDGNRQIIDFQIPGDFIGLRSVLLRASDHSFEPIVGSEVAEVGVSDLLHAFSKAPRLATAMLWAASRDEAMVVEHLVGVGCREAGARIGHFLLELGLRLALVGLGDRMGYDCPLTQYHLADTLGLSAIHVNRTLRQLREGGLLTFRDGRVTFHDYDGLVALSGFDPAYLDQTGPLLK